MKMRKTLLLLVLCMIPFAGASAQTNAVNDPVRPSSDIWEFMKYGTSSPSLYTGEMRTQIGLYLYEDPDFEIPICLDYASNGCQPNIHAGNAGVGWTITAGGVITREINGVPDDRRHNIALAGPVTPQIYGFAYASTHGLSADSSQIYTGGNPADPSEPWLYWRDDSTGTLYDAEPDIFHFSFMGYSGSFMMGRNGEILFFDTNISPGTIKAELDFSYDNYKSAISLIASDGYRYEFDGYTGRQDINVETFYSYGTIILSWRLSRIIAPNGRKAEFKYRTNPDVYSMLPSSVSYSIISNSGIPGDLGTSTIRNSEKSLSKRGLMPVNLTSVEIDGGATINLQYTAIKEKSFSTADESEAKTTELAGNSIVSSVEILYKGTRLKYCSFTYDNSNPGKRNFLKSINIAGEGSYLMEYISPAGIPMHGTFKIDHWGYFNGKTSDKFLKISSLSQNGDETYDRNNPREADGNYGRYGMLSKITYPTGGYSTFSYENNDYSYEVKRKAAKAFYPTVEPAHGIAGGVRVSEIRDYDAGGKELYSRKYSYKGYISGKSSGILVHSPRYQTNFSTALGSYTTSGTIWSNSLTHYDGTHVEYSEVMEKLPDGSAFLYKFTTANDWPDTLEHIGIIPQRTHNVQGADRWKDPGQIKNLFMNTSRHSKRGRLLQKDYLLQESSGTSVILRESYKMKTLTPSSDAYAYTPRYLLYSSANEGIDISRLETSLIEVTMFSDGGSICKTTELDYDDSFLLKTKTERTDEAGAKSITWKRIIDVGKMAAEGSAELSMYMHGMLDTPVEMLFRSGDNLATVDKKVTYSYVMPAASEHPSLFRIGSVTETDGKTGKSFMTSYRYDSMGRLVEKKDPEGISTIYIWGYGGLYPIAEIKNAHMTDISTISGLNAGMSPLEGNLTESQEEALRSIPGAETTVWDYIPLTGLAKETGPDGRSEYITYNSSGKLHMILDDLGRKKKEFLYSGDNKK